jgi:hypothetical protein
LIRHSSRRKDLWKNSKGLSNLIGLIFLVFIAFFIGTNVFLFSVIQQTSFQLGISEVNLKDSECSNEMVTASNTAYSVIGNQVNVETLIENRGPISVHIITLWTIDQTIQKYGYNHTVSIYIKPGQTYVFSESNSLYTTIVGTEPFHSFLSWIVTERGNLIQLQPFEPPQEVVVAQVSQGIGSIALDMEQFRYFTFASDQVLASFPNGVVGFNTPKNCYVAFGCYLTNLDPSMERIVIDAHSLFWQPGRPGVAEGAWFIVNVNPDGTILGTYSNITINYGETKMLIFASQNDLSIGAFGKAKTPNVVTTVATFLLLHGTIGNRAYAQSIPFVSIFYV